MYATFQVTGMAYDGERLTGAQTTTWIARYITAEYILHTSSRVHIRYEATHYYYYYL
jgi:hypothetical protein